MWLFAKEFCSLVKDTVSFSVCKLSASEVEKLVCI